MNQTSLQPRRFGRILKLKPASELEYKEYHRHIWPEVADAIREAGIRNYSIYLNNDFLFSYFELEPGLSLQNAADYLNNNEKCREWEALMNRMQEPLENAKSGEWWTEMEEIFHQD